MLVPLLPADGATPATWAMVELQGEIDRRDGGSESQALDVGVITTSSNGTVMLTIGYHQLEGKRQALKKPMALLSKADADSQGADGSDQLAYKVVGVVREKYLFKSRPRALITKPHPKG